MSEELLTVFYCCDWWMDVSKISTVIPWWGRLLPQAHAGHSANHRLHRSSSWKCLANPDATGRNGLWWTWHLFISSIFGTKCWSWISSMTSSSSLRFSRSGTPPQRRTIADTTDTTAVVAWHPRCPWATWCTPRQVVRAVQCSALQGPSTVQFAQSVSDIHLPVSHPSWRSAALARLSLKWPQAWPTSEEKVEKGWMQYMQYYTQQIHLHKWIGTYLYVYKYIYIQYIYICMYAYIMQNASKCNIIQSTSEVWWFR